VARSPLAGDRLWHYQAAYARYSLPKWRMALGHAHNYYLNIAAETGLIGLLAYVFCGRPLVGILSMRTSGRRVYLLERSHWVH